MALAGRAPVVSVRGLGFGHPGEAPLFNGLSFDLMPGVTIVRGDSGSGKTSLLRLLAGEWTGVGESRGPAPADVCWFDPRDERFDDLTAEGLMQALRGRHATLDLATWRAHLAGFELLPHLSKPLYAMSRGSRQKAALAVALASGSPLVLLDEPTAGLDSASIRYLASVLVDFGARTGQALAMACSLELDGLVPSGVIDL